MRVHAANSGQQFWTENIKDPRLKGVWVATDCDVVRRVSAFITNQKSGSSSRQPISDRAVALQNMHTPRNFWEELEPVWDVAQLRQEDLALPDRQAVKAIYGKYFDASVVLRSEFLPTDLHQLRDMVESSLHSAPNTPEGRAVRLEVNRALIGACDSNLDTQRAALGGCCFVLASDMANGDGNQADAGALFGAGSSYIDFALGLIPFVSAVNNGTQIVYGMTTGHDYAGHPMHSADYALRSLGVVLGAIPGEKLVEIAGKTIGVSFQTGASLLRKFNLGDKLETGLPAGRALIKDFVELIGENLPWQYINSQDPERIAERVNQIVLGEQRLLQELPNDPAWSEVADDLWLKMRSTTVAIDDLGNIKFSSNVYPHDISLPTSGLYSRVLGPDLLPGIEAGSGALGRGSEAFITASEDLNGLNTAEEIAQKLGIDGDLKGSYLIQFKFVDEPVLQTPVDFDGTNPRKFPWLYGGLNLGGAREWIIPSTALQKKVIQMVSTPIKISH